MAFSDVAIKIAADFIGAPAFKKADTAVTKLYKTTTKLAGAFGLTFSAVQLSRFGVSAVREFASAEREAQTLLGTMQSLNLAFASPQMGQFLDDLEKVSGINRAELQPALQKLITQTGSLTKSQEILNTAVAVSFSGLMDVSSAANILTQAYVGNKKGLRQFNLGLDTATLSVMSFEDILAKVDDTYRKQFEGALESATVKMNKLKNATENAKENIGEGLVGAFKLLVGGGDLDKATSKLERFSQILGGLIANAFNPVKVGDFYLPIPNLAKAFEKPFNNSRFGVSRAPIAALERAEKEAREKALAAERKRLELLRQQTAQKRAQVALDKASAVLSKSKEMFDLEGIQIQAALQGKISDVDRARLETMKLIYDLEKAIEQNNISLIERLTAQLNTQVKQTQELNNQSAALKLIQDLLARIGYDRSLFDLSNISQAMALLNQMSGLQYTPSQFATVPNLPQIYDIMINSLPNAAAEEVVVQVNVTESAKKLVDIIMETVTEQSASGNPPFTTRVGESFAW